MALVFLLIVLVRGNLKMRRKCISLHSWNFKSIYDTFIYLFLNFILLRRYNICIVHNIKSFWIIHWEVLLPFFNPLACDVSHNNFRDPLILISFIHPSVLMYVSISNYKYVFICRHTLFTLPFWLNSFSGYLYMKAVLKE